MKTSTKISIGLSIAAVASVSVAVIASEKIAKKVYHVTNRCKAKKFVNDKFGGNEKLLSIVDKLSDDELDSMMDVLGKVKDSGKKISSYGESLKDSTENVKDRLFSFIDELM
ncbi:hypothetical protein JZO66_00395 [Enterococcus sp. DIV0242_7C1]|uniref:General stress protein n=1 Tax=Candidatus Enterococcus dunnyi TaxID=1834192 RepID=A0A200JEY3_9ENTE|nr:MULTISPECIES: hypothetical protein [unclassified Enterococcus]MBO0468983.1 hypothetical protein [Enterococcus sp. DIV0242_7C1]MCA5012570.1 hypothetical protein [Enterococcus sp. S23]MCA5015821.1 hypothetical protein [Enterococcus sp. S22(2020)]OUZ35724.1 hypothetical protein A5889_001200 [Enterococcus sp. 9D6_DIV0238]